MLCTNGHNNPDIAKFCATCGVNTFQPGTMSTLTVTNSASTNGLAVAAMVLGIVWIYWAGSVLALIFGYVARSQIKQSGEKGAGMAIAGIVLGWVGMGFLLLFIVLAASVSHVIHDQLQHCHLVGNDYVCH